MYTKHYDGVRRKAEQPHLSATVQAWRLFLFGQTAWMPDESDVKQILTASPWRTGGDHRDAPVLRGWRLPSRTWNHWTSPWMKQLTWLRIVHSGEWRLALRTHSGACQKWMKEWNIQQQQTVKDLEIEICNSQAESDGNTDDNDRYNWCR